jgi:hypothetical protein
MAKQIENDYDVKGFAEAKQVFNALKADRGKQIEVMKASKRIFLMDWQARPKNSKVKVTISPDGKNKVKGGVRLLTATQPHFKVPNEKNNPEVVKVSSTLEQMASVMWSRSNHLQACVVERDLALSGFLYDEMGVAVVKMQDIVDRLREGLAAAEGKYEKARWEGRVRKAEEAAALTPYQFEVVNPLTTYPRFGRGGNDLCGMEVKRTADDVRAHWGQRAEKALAGYKGSQEVTECRLVDETFEYVWLAERSGEPIFADVHDLPFLPIIYVRAEGSRLFDEAEYQIDPFLRTLAESGIWEMKNRIWTALNTNLTATVDAQWVFKKAKDEDQIEVDHDKFLGIVNLPPQTSLEPLTKDIVSKDVIAMWQLIEQAVADSTMYDQALGAGTGQKDPYALVSLLNQAGRLPLSGVQKMMGELLARTMEVTFQWLKAGGKQTKMQKRYGDTLTLKPSEIPSVIEFVCDVDVDLPQDKLQQANIAGMLKKEKLASNEWIQSNILNIENPDQMSMQIFKEMATDGMGQETVKQVIQMAMSQSLPNAATESGDPPGGGPEAMPAGAPGMTVQGGLPPTMKGAMPKPPPNMQGGGGGLPPEMMTGGQA